MAKTLEQIKDDYAKSVKYEGFMHYVLEGGGITESDVNSIAKLYSNSMLEKAADVVQNYDPRRAGMHYVDNKQSILNLREEV